MRNRGSRLLGVVWIALFSAAWAGCVDLETGPVGNGGTHSGSGGDGGTTSQGGQTGQTGTGNGGSGGEVSSGGPVASEWVGATGTGKSGSYRMEYTFGQPMDQGFSSSTSYRLQSGPVGASWSEQ